MRGKLAKCFALPLLATPLWAVGQIARDQWWLTALFFYLPSPLLCAGLWLAAAVSWRKRRRLAAASLAASILPAAMVLAVENRWRRPPSDPVGDELTLVHWNVMHGFLGWDRIHRELRRHPADVYVLSEIPKKLSADELSALGEGFSPLRDSTLAVVCRGIRKGDMAQRWPKRVRSVHAVCQAKGRSLDVLAVDLPSSLWIARQPLLEEVVRRIARHRPDVTVGDFNAPRRSVALESLPEGVAHAYRGAGRGWPYTWPVPLPVLAIDQCILGDRVRPIEYSLATNLLSDHRLQTVRFSWEPDLELVQIGWQINEAETAEEG